MSLDIGCGYMLKVLNEKYSVPNCVKMHSVEQYFHLTSQENISVCYCWVFFPTVQSMKVFSYLKQCVIVNPSGFCFGTSRKKVGHSRRNHCQEERSGVW